MTGLAYVPFLTPVNFFHERWYLLAVPLALLISMAYKAMRTTRWDRYWRQVGMMTVQILLGMIGLAVGLLVLVEWVVPLLPVE